jgi:hypothetical protein
LRRTGVIAPIPDEHNDNTGSVVVIRVRGRTYQLDGDTFTQWQVREVAADIAVNTDELYSEVVGEVINTYIAALDERAVEAAA